MGKRIATMEGSCTGRELTLGKGRWWTSLELLGGLMNDVEDSDVIGEILETSKCHSFEFCKK